MSSAIEGLQPEAVWRYFAEISRIPRCSKHEAAASRYVLDQARRLGLEAEADALGNVVVRVGPTLPGDRPGVVLQGHLDMVCEKNRETRHDFATDPIRLVRRDNVITADGTTLGADNGIAVAAMLAVMEDRSLEHGPLELLFTVDEETGLTGAAGLGPHFVRGRILLNLDSEEEGTIYIGCSGGRDTTGLLGVRYEEANPRHAALSVKVTGLKGGHSGLEIDRGRANAVKVMGRVLSALAPLGARLASVDGGDKHNAIPRECEAVLFLPPGKLKAAGGTVERCSASIRAEFSAVEPDLRITLAPLHGDRPAMVLRRKDQLTLLRLLAALPHGVIKMSAEIPGLVETSTNLAAVHTGEEGARIVTSQRSPVASELDEIAAAVVAIMELGGAAIETSDAYPGWKPDLSSPILKIAREAYRELYGKEPQAKAIHAGLECGVIGKRFPGMDMISFGPTLEGAHSPEERMQIDTVEKFWDLLLAILRRV